MIDVVKFHSIKGVVIEAFLGSQEEFQYTVEQRSSQLGQGTMKINYFLSSLHYVPCPIDFMNYDRDYPYRVIPKYREPWQFVMQQASSFSS